jgi:hypothetical protein
MNLPGSRSYDPRLPWVSKVKEEDSRIAARVATYVDSA